MIPLVIIFSKPNIPKFETSIFECIDLDDCKNKLIITIKKNIEKQIDYPSNLDDFASLCWFHENSMENEVFEYYIFYQDKIQTIWTPQELYLAVVENIYLNDVQNAIFNPNNYVDYNSDNEK
jgi:hypothetical protein